MLVLRWTIISVFIIFGLTYMISMPNRSYSGPFQPLSENEELLRERIKKHINILAEKIGERNIWHYDKLEASADYIEKTFEDLGYKVELQEFQIEGVTLKNLEAELIGTSRPEKIIVVGAHYDSVIGSPGANDNASGVAAILEIARLIAGEELSQSVRFVAFVNEEPPFFQTKDMGSRVYASRSRKRGEQIVAMLSIETIGFYSEDPRSQHYPFPFSFFYPHTGNFIGFVSNLSSRNLVQKAITTFRENTAFPSEGVAAPGWITGIGWSDHWSFWKEGYPAIMITDTAPYRYKHYHAPEDTIDKIDYARMARVVEGLARVVTQLAGAKTLL